MFCALWKIAIILGFGELIEMPLKLSLKVGNPWWDGFSFSLPQGTTSCLEITPSANVSNTVMIGADKTPLPTPLNLETLGPCTTPVPTLSIANSTASEADPFAIFTVSLSASATDVVSVDYATIADSATEGLDYTATMGTLIFNPGDTSLSINVPLLQDSLEEGTEQFSLMLSNAINAPLTQDTATGTINDDEIILSACGAPAWDKKVDNGLLLWKDCTTGIWQGRVSTDPVTKSIRLNATLDSDAGFTSVNGISIENSDIFDTSDPNQLKLSLKVGNPWWDGFSFSLPQGTTSCLEITPSANVSNTVMIGADKTPLPTPLNLETLGPCTTPVPTLSIANSTASEADPFAIFTVSLSAPATDVVSVDYAAIADSASEGLDYTATMGTLTFNPGDTSLNISVPLLQDNLQEDTEQFSLSFSNPVNAIFGATTIATALITDVISIPSISIEGSTAFETDAFAIFTVSLSAPATDVVSVDYATIADSATEGLDFTATSGSLTFNPGDTSQNINVPLLQDSLQEGSEQFSIVLSNLINATSGATTVATAVITDVISIPSISIEGSTAFETDTFAIFTVSLSASVTDVVSVDYITVDDSATQGQDYTATTGTLTFNPGNTSLNINVPLLQDNFLENTEQFSINLSSPINATLKSINTAFVQIMDVVPLPTMSITNTQATETDAFVSFTVSLSAASTDVISVGYSTLPDTATENLDYTATIETLSFSPGETSLTIDIPLLQDNLLEGSEQFFIQLANPVNATLASAIPAVAEIIDVPPVPSLSITSTLASEADAFATFNVVLSFPALQVTTVNYTTVPDSAVDGQDYTTTAGSLSFNPGESQISIDVPLLQDLIQEGTEQFFIQLANPVNATLESTAMAAVQIDDDELSACNAPDYTSGINTGVFLWQDCVNLGHWTLRVVSDGTSATQIFQATFASDQYFFMGPGQLFSNITTSNLEASDLLDTQDPLQLKSLMAVTNNGFDEFSFDVPAGADVCFNLNFPTLPVYIGEKKVVMPAAFQINTLDSCLNPGVLNTLDLSSGTVVADYDFGANIAKNLDTSDQIGKAVTLANGWQPLITALITADFDVTPTGTATTQISAPSGASKWIGVEHVLSTLTSGTVYELELEVKPGDDKFAITVYEGASDAKWIFYLNDAISGTPYIRVQAGFKALWTELVDQGNGWFTVKIRIDTDDAATAISDWNNVSLRLYHNQLQTDAPAEYGNVMIYQPELSQLYKHFYTRYAHGRDFNSQGIGRAQALNNAWSRMSDNDNHRLETDHLDLVAQLYSLTDGGIESGMIRSRMIFDPTKSYYYEARIKPSLGNGFWTNFWINSNDPTAWPPEIDIVEIVQSNGAPEWNNYTSFHTLHGNFQSPNIFSHDKTLGNQYSNVLDYTAAYHTFAALVTPTHTAWFVDDVLVRYAQMLWFENGTSTPAPGPNFILDFMVGGDWPGAPENAADFPATFSVDYVKAWELP